MGPYIHEHADWPHFRWSLAALAEPLEATRHRQGVFAGRVQALGFRTTQHAVLEALADEIQKSSEIEGEFLVRDQVRSSIARRLGIEAGALIPAETKVEGVVEMTLDATQNYAADLTAERVFGWHSAMFPSGRSGMHRITVGAWRDGARGPMQVVSGPIGRERVHFEAPEAARVQAEMQTFFAWFNSGDILDPVLKAALAHLWSVTIHPFDDGNGRIARAIADMALARAEGSGLRFYSMSAEILKRRNEYYTILERTQKGDLDITPWMSWFVACLDRAVQGAEGAADAALGKARFWNSIPDGFVNERQRTMLNRLLDGFERKLTNRKWALITKCSADTALRDIQDLIRKDILIKDDSSGRSTSYSLRLD